MKMLLFGLAGGFISGAIGLGGGVIFNPLFLKLDVTPMVASATGMYLVLFSTASSSILYSIHLILPFDYAFFMGLFIFIGTYLGLKSINDLVKKSGRASLLVIALTIVIAISAILTPIVGGLNAKSDDDKGKDIFAFASFC
jgi:uncharacterized membrane protein YfcA